MRRTGNAERSRRHDGSSAKRSAATALPGTRASAASVRSGEPSPSAARWASSSAHSRRATSGRYGQVARVRIRREKIAERGAVHVEVAARGRMRERVRVDRGVEERRAGEIADHAVRRAERVAIVRPHRVAVDGDALRRRRRRPGERRGEPRAAAHAATASHASRMACAVAASPASTANAGMSMSHSISVGTRTEPGRAPRDRASTLRARPARRACR